MKTSVPHFFFLCFSVALCSNDFQALRKRLMNPFCFGNLRILWITQSLWLMWVLSLMNSGNLRSLVSTEPFETLWISSLKSLAIFVGLDRVNLSILFECYEQHKTGRAGWCDHGGGVPLGAALGASASLVRRVKPQVTVGVDVFKGCNV